MRTDRIGGRWFPWRLCLLVGLSLGSAVACDMHGGSKSMATGYTSEREEKYARTHPEYRARLRLAESMAKQVNTDSLRTLYVRALEARPDESAMIAHQVQCEITRHMFLHPFAVALRAQKHLSDSMQAVPGTATRWHASRAQWPNSTTADGCDLGTPKPDVDSLSQLPHPNSLQPFNTRY